MTLIFIIFNTSFKVIFYEIRLTVYIRRISKFLIATSDSFYTSCQSTLPWSYDRSGLCSEGYIRFRKIDIVWLVSFMGTMVSCHLNQSRPCSLGRGCNSARFESQASWPHSPWCKHCWIIGLQKIYSDWSYMWLST